MVLPGFTDSRHFRLAFPECVAYGFFPQRHQTLLESAPLIHGADERIDVRDLAFATELFRDLAVRVLGLRIPRSTSAGKTRIMRRNAKDGEFAGEGGQVSKQAKAGRARLGEKHCRHTREHAQRCRERCRGARR